MSLIVCCTTLYLLRTYFKRSKRVLVYLNLIISYILYQTTYVTELIIRLLYKDLGQLTTGYSQSVVKVLLSLFGIQHRKQYCQQLKISPIRT